jgi:hypothetical protein
VDSSEKHSSIRSVGGFDGREYRSSFLRSCVYGWSDYMTYNRDCAAYQLKELFINYLREVSALGQDQPSTLSFFVFFFFSTPPELAF